MISIERVKDANMLLPVIKITSNYHRPKGRRIFMSRNVYKIMKFIEKADREMFYVLHLSANLRLIAMELVSIGSLNDSTAHPREVFKGAILNNSARVILVHNHPSGDTVPSRDDIKTTKALVEAGKILGIPVLDHVIIGHNDFFSLEPVLRAIENKKKTENKHTQKAIDILIRQNEGIKNKATLNKREIKKHSKTLRIAAYEMFSAIGVSKIGLKDCYNNTVKYLTNKSPKGNRDAEKIDCTAF